MKKAIIIGMILFGFMIQTTVALAYLYDDFSTGSLDTDKWEIRQDVEGQPFMEEYWVDIDLENFHTQQTTAVDRRVYLVPKILFRAGYTLEYDFDLVSASGIFAQMILLTGSDYHRLAGMDSSLWFLGKYHITLKFFEDHLEVSRHTPIDTYINQTIPLTNPDGEYELYIGSFSNGVVHIDYDNFEITTPVIEPECNCTKTTERISELEEEVEDLKSRVEALEQGQGTIPTHTHPISDVIGLQNALDSINSMLHIIVCNIFPKGLLKAAKFDTSYCQ